MMPTTPMSALPPKDARTVTDDRIQEETEMLMPPGARQQQGSVFHVSTADGDVKTLVVEPSFDGSEKEVTKPEENRESWKGVRATEEGKSTAAPGRSQPSPEEGKQPASHARNLSAHFFDAATIRDSTSERDAPGVSFDDQSQRSYPNYPTQHSSNAPEEQATIAPTTGAPASSPAVGQKHRRGISEDISNPAFAHRRINSTGVAAPVERGQGESYYDSNTYRQPPAYDHQSNAPPLQQASHHHREGSAGLDMLSAAIHAAGVVSKEELADAAGAPQKNAAAADQPIGSSPGNDPRESQPAPSHSAMRMSPSTMGNAPYDYGQTGGTMGAPPLRPPSGAQQPIFQQHRGPVNLYPPQGFYPGQSYYPPGTQAHPHGPPQGYHQRQLSRGPPLGYPMQYAPARGPQAHYGKAPQYPPAQPQHVAPPTTSSAMPLGHHSESGGKIETDEHLFSNRTMPPQQWGAPPRPGTSTGVQTFVTTMSVGDGSKMMRAAPTHKAAGVNTDPSNEQQQQQATIPSHVGHHRKMSSFSSLSTLLGSSAFPEDQSAAQAGHHRQGSSYFHNPTDQSSRPVAPPPPEAHHRSTSSSMSFLNTLDDKTVGGHHRSTSSSVSFLHGLDNFDPNEAFTAGLDVNGQQFVGPNTMHSSPYSSGPPFSGGPPRPGDPLSSTQCISIMGPPSSIASAPVSEVGGRKSSDRLAAGGTSKRVRRKCTIEGCPNRVVQGGLCISHGAKRKQCKHPGCTKNVKKAGLCSTHGPARKRCEAEGCSKVAVQGGRCIAHGAKKKLCSVGGCNKQAILSGMCKKHHDQKAGIPSGRRRESDASTASERDSSPTVAASAPKPAEHSRQAKRPSHTRGLSIFQEISPENVQTILSEPPGAQAVAPENRGQQDSFGYNNRMM